MTDLKLHSVTKCCQSVARAFAGNIRLVTAMLCLFTGFSASASLSHSENLIKAQALAAKNRVQLNRVTEQLKTTTSTTLAPRQSLYQLNDQLKEFQLRQYFYNRLTFIIERHYKTSAPLAAYLQQSFQNMAKVEKKTNPNNFALRQFIKSLSDSIGAFNDTDDDVFAFIDGYVNYSTISRPKASSDYALQRDYTNGRSAYRANTIEKDQVGSAYESQIVRAEREHQRRQLILKVKTKRAKTPVKVPTAAVKMAKTAREEIDRKEKQDEAFTTVEAPATTPKPSTDQTVSLEPQTTAQPEQANPAPVTPNVDTKN